MRIKIILSYDGSAFNGFQIQQDKNITTIAGVITKALRNININTVLVGSGRTDSGVHAIAQVLHCEVPEFWSDLVKLKKELNRTIAPSIYIKDLVLVEKDFHARFSAKKRLYRYFLYEGNYQPFLSNYALHVDKIDVKMLNATVKKFVGIHDFKNFKKLGSDTNSDIREIFKAGAYTHKNMTIIYFLGNSFLRSQVRIMCSFSLEIMQKNFTSKQLEEQLDGKKKHHLGVIPPSGLYLSKIYY